MIALIILDPSDLPECIQIDNDAINMNKLTSTDAVYVNESTILIVDKGKFYSNNDLSNNCKLVRIDCECATETFGDEISLVSFRFPKETIDATNDSLVEICNILEKGKTEENDEDDQIKTETNENNDISVVDPKLPINEKYPNNGATTSKSTQHILNEHNIKSTVTYPQKTILPNNNDFSMFQNYSHQPTSFRSQNNTYKTMSIYNNQNYLQSNLKQEIKIDDLDKDNFDEFLRHAVDSGLTLKINQLKSISINKNEDELKKHILIHNSYVKFNASGQQTDIIKTDKIFSDRRVNKEMQDFIKKAELIKITNASGRIEILIKTLKDPYCIAICLQIPYFSISKAVEPGLWTKGINYTFKTDKMIKKYSLFDMCANLTVEQIDQLRACAPVVSFLLSNNKMSKFHTEQKIFYTQSGSVMINTSPFIESCTKNITGTNKTKVNDKIRSNINKMVECLRSIDKLQFDDINNSMAIALKQFKGNALSNFLYS